MPNAAARKDDARGRLCTKHNARRYSESSRCFSPAVDQNFECFQSAPEVSENWAMVRNTNTNWGWPAKALHWIAAMAILVLLIHGWWMTHITPRPEPVRQL